MFGTTQDLRLPAAMARLALRAAVGPRLGEAIVKHAEVILRVALVSGAFVGYALTEIIR